MIVSPAIGALVSGALRDRVMLHPEGGFYSAEDAESAVDPARPDDKEEGAFYTWTTEEIDRLLEPRDAAVFNFVYGVEAEGNAALDPHQEFVGENILYQAHSLGEAAAQFDLTRSETAGIVEEARRTLFAAREQRPHAHLHDKILLSWNGLMISAYANAYRILADECYRETAERSVRFLYDRLRDDDAGAFRRRYRDGEARYDAHLEDYAFFTLGLIDLYEATKDRAWLARAETLVGQVRD